MTEKGPIYGVELIDTLPIGTGSMLQQMPDREDLQATRKFSDRTAAGYEVLLSHWRAQSELCDRLLKALLCPTCGGSGRMNTVACTQVKCDQCEAAKIRREAKP